MRVKVLFFGVLKDLVHTSEEQLNLAEGATLAQLLDHYQRIIPQLKSFQPSLAFSINQAYAHPETELQAGDEVALLPPVSGGAPRVALTRETIATQHILEQIKHPEDGATVVFEGIVRNHTRGRRTLYLDYEAYEAMARKQLESLADQALQQFKIRDLAIVHRLGRLEIGETSVLIVVASAHRAPAFEACRWLIDTLKRKVPIWKKEYFEDGAVWADGEPFPDELLRAEGTHSGAPASNLKSPS